MTKLVFIRVLHLVMFGSFCNGELVRCIPTINHTQLGHLNLASLVSVYQMGPAMCSDKISSAYDLQYLLAAIYGIETVNNDPTLLGNIRLGIIGLEDCDRGVAGVGQALKLIAGSSKDLEFVGLKPVEEGALDIVGVIGALTSTGSMAVANLLNLFDITMISPAATSDDLSDRFKYPNFYRMVPPDSFQAKVMIDLLAHFNWSYISVVHAENSYGYGGLTFMRQHAKIKGVCIAKGFPLADDFTEADYEQTIIDLQRIEKSTVVPVFAYDSQMRKLLWAASRLKVTTFTWILSEAAYARTVSGVEDIMQGSFLVDWYIPIDETIRRYIETTPLNTYPSSNFLPEVWRQLAPDKCNGSSDLSAGCLNTSLQDIEGFDFSSAVVLATEAVYIYAESLDQLIKDHCSYALEDPERLGDCIKVGDVRAYLVKVALQTRSGIKQFNADGAMYLDFRIRRVEGMGVKQVGVWRNGTIEWGEGAGEGMGSRESVCAKPCQVGEVSIQGEVPCCWDCYRCRDNEILTPDASACESCPQLTWPDNFTFTRCLRIEPSFMTWFDLYGIGLVSLAGIGLVCSLVVIVVFNHNRHRRAIKGASVEMVSLVLGGLVLMFADPLLFIAKPSRIVCICGRVLYGLSGSLVFAPLLVKTHRVYLVFSASDRLAPVSRFAQAGVNYTVTVILILIQVSLLTVSAFLWPIDAVETMPITTMPYVELHCHQAQEGLLTPLSFNLLLIVVCSFLAFLTRKLPDNFNESWYIFLSVSTTLFVWVAFLPTYYAAFFAYHKSALLGLALILNGMTVLVCLFVPKIYALAFVPDNEIKITNFTSSSFDQKSTNVPHAPSCEVK